jgi:TRAP transporter TAXI family solute receptor
MDEVKESARSPDEVASARAWIRVAAIVGAVAFTACTQARPEPIRPTVRLTTGPPGGGFYPIGERLGIAWARLLPDVNIEVHASAGGVANVEAIQQGNADVGFTFADVAYIAYEGQLDAARYPFDRLRGIAVLQWTPVHLVVGPNVGISTVQDLRGRRVGLGPPGSGTNLTASLVLHAFNVDINQVRTQLLSFDEAERRLIDGSLDAMFDNAVYPADSVLKATLAGARILPLTGKPVQRLNQDYPFLRMTLIPPETYTGVSSAVHTIGVESLLVCRRDLDEALVYQLTKYFFSVLPSLSLSQDALRFVDPDQASATPIPLHEGAARYYRERELIQ